MASSGKKRSFAEFAGGSAPTLTVITADGVRMPAHNDVLRLVCSCLRKSPASDTWDLSNLLVNGSPVSQEAVTAVLEVLYSNLGALGFEADRTAGQYSLAQLLEMLLFADAVGCSRAVLNQLAGLLCSCVRAELEFRIRGSSNGGGSGRRREDTAAAAAAAAAAAEEQAGTARSKLVTLQLDSVYKVDSEGGVRWLRHVSGTHSSLVCVLTAQQEQQLLAQVPRQLEVLLWVGFKLDLQQLLASGLRFLRANAHRILLRCLNEELVASRAIFSRRVLEAAGGASGAELLCRSFKQQPLGLGLGVGSVFTDVKYDLAQAAAPTNVIRFDATLARDLYEFGAGSVLLLLVRGSVAGVTDLYAFTVSGRRCGMASQQWFGVLVAGS
uniref:Uncharacterized protein n=1 Tax=Tetradesmus obliquus TaxID=3088 RepID=A0A383V9G6_TETOB|eukprot:jgi/Sobl393_1/18209/SZX62227.1